MYISKPNEWKNEFMGMLAKANLSASTFENEAPRIRFHAYAL
jgi:hypothetical protein